MNEQPTIASLAKTTLPLQTFISPTSAATLTLPSVQSSPTPVATAALLPTIRPLIVPMPDELIPGGVVFRLADMRVRQQKDLVYKVVDNLELRLDIYYPLELKSNELRSTVILGHGRGGKDSAPWVSWGRLLAASGFVAVVFNYRDPPGGAPADILSDFQDLLAYVRTNAIEFNIDRNRLALMGFSALSRHHFSAGLRGNPPYVKALVSYYGWLDNDDASLSPLQYLQTQAGPFPPMFIVKAGKDRFGADIKDSIDRFVAAAQAKHLDVEFMVHPDGLHGFDTLNDDDTSREIIRRTIEFLKTKLAL